MESSRSSAGVARPGAVALSVEDHRRDAAGLTYVYPVLSRRAGGISLGINLNVNNACNWACIYCQVPGLVRGGPPPIEVARLAGEFAGLLDEILAGRFSAAGEGEAPRLVDVAFSGNGEPTSADEFGDVLDRVTALLAERGLAGRVPVRVITNGSLLHRPAVQEAFRKLGAAGGEAWFKVDRASEAGMREVNASATTPEAVRARLDQCCALVPTWVQTCWFAIDGQAPCEEESVAYVDFLAGFAGRIRGVHLYGIARPSMQPAAGRLTRLDHPTLAALAERLKAKGLTVTVSP